MVNLVPPTEIEGHVGVPRHDVLHIGRAVSKTGQFYILHSKECFESGEPLTDCEYSWALEWGISDDEWYGWEDLPVVLYIHNEDLLPAGVYYPTV